MPKIISIGSGSFELEKIIRQYFWDIVYITETELPRRLKHIYTYIPCTAKTKLLINAVLKQAFSSLKLIVQ